VTPSVRNIRFITAILSYFVLFAAGAIHAQVPQGIVSVEISPDGTRLAIGGTNELLKIVDRTTGVDQLVLSGFSGSVFDVSWSPDGTRLASAHPGDDSARIWNAVSGTLVIRLPFSDSVAGVHQVQWSPNGTWFAAYDHDPDSVLRIYNSETFSLQCETIPSTIYDMDWHPNSNFLAMAAGSIKLIEVSTCSQSEIIAASAAA